MYNAYILLGSNVGEMEAYLMEARLKIGKRYGPALLFSSLYVSPTLGYTDELAWDERVVSLAPALRNNWLTPLAIGIHYGFDTIPLLIISVLICAWLIYRKRRWDALIYASVMLANAASLLMLKEFLARGRPLGSLIPDESFSFPSGHSATAVVFWGYLAYLVSQASLPRYPKYSIVAILILIIPITLLSRLYIGIHWLTDVIGGLFLGLFWLAAAIAVRKYTKSLKTV